MIRTINKDLNDIQDFLGDWQKRNFGEQESWKCLLGLQEELGELSHSWLKRSQNIRIEENHDEKIKDAVGDIFIYLMNFCNLDGIKFTDCLKVALDEISNRDWMKNKVDGRKDE